MLRVKTFVSAIFISLLFLLGSEFALAQSQGNEPEERGNNHSRFYGVGQPKSIQDLPPGQLRKDLESLHPSARGKALGWLQRASFPAEDVNYLRVSQEGHVKFADTFVPELTDAANVSADVVYAPAWDATQVFQLHSKPGAPNVLFLDFDGHTIEGTRWNSNGNVLVALPFDPSMNDSPNTSPDFTDDERNRIAIIWHRVSEDFAAFNIDVTTEEPEVFTPTTGHVLFTHDSDASGQAMPSQNAGGTAWVGVFGNSDYVTRSSPALVYYTNLSSDPAYYGVPAYNAEAASHEFGHNIGLFHDGTTSGTSYYGGHGSGLVSWAPIMGYSYGNIVTHWSKGDYPNANNTEDDIDKIAYDLGYVEDDHGDSAAQATALEVESNGDILVSSPKADPDNLLPANKGIINDRNDVDWFYLDVADGVLNITATPAWHSWDYDDRGGNLDIEMTLFDSNLAMLTMDEPTDRTDATLVASLAAGRYYIQIDGVGNNTNSNYSDYSSLGMYFIEGNVQTGSGDNTAPSPTTMAWQTTPYQTGNSSISMTATQAEDDSDNVEYYFSCVTGGNGCNDSGWQASRSWSPSGLDANTYYSYNVKARDAFGNENSSSPTMGDTTAAPPAENDPPSAVASYNPAPAVITKGKTASVTLSGSGSSDPDGIIFSYEWKDSNGATISTSMSLGVKLRAGAHDFTLTVTDDDGASDSTNLSVSVTKAGSDSGDVGDGGGGGGKKCNPRKQVCS